MSELDNSYYESSLNNLDNNKISNVINNIRSNLYLLIMLIMTITGSKIEAKDVQGIKVNAEFAFYNSKRHKENTYLQEFEKYRKAILAYKPLSDSLIPDINNIHNQFFDSSNLNDLPKINIDFTNIPNGKELSVDKILDILKSSNKYDSIKVVKPDKEKDTGVICIYFAQSHSSWGIDNNGNFTSGMDEDSIENQTAILKISEILIAQGIRIFGMENKVGNYNFSLKDESKFPANSFKNFQLLNNKAIYKKIQAGISEGYPAFEVLQSVYPFIDLYGCDAFRDGIRNNIIPVQYQLEKLQKTVINLFDYSFLLDINKYKAFKKWLLRLPNGEKVLRDIKYYHYILLWYFSAHTDDYGTDGTGFAVYDQLHRLSQVIKDSTFLNLQGKSFAPNVFALQYGVLHSISEKNGIAGKCKQLGVTCIQVLPKGTTTNLGKSMTEVANERVILNNRIIEIMNNN